MARIAGVAGVFIILPIESIKAVTVKYCPEILAFGRCHIGIPPAKPSDPIAFAVEYVVLNSESDKISARVKQVLDLFCGSASG